MENFEKQYFIEIDLRGLNVVYLLYWINGSSFCR